MPHSDHAILVVDDDSALRRLMARRMRGQNYRVAEAATGADAIAQASACHFDLVTIDHDMPDMDGLTLLRHLRDSDDPPAVVYVTGVNEVQLAVTALKAGAADYVHKTTEPDFLDLLLATLDQVLVHTEVDADLRLANRRLATMLTEVNHRVSNSLQLVSTLVGLQERQMTDPAARTALSLAQTRIQAIGQIHHCLYTGEDVMHVDMAVYLTSLIERLRWMLGRDDAACPLTIETKPLRLSTDQAVAVGMIVLELVTNACKYAYPGGCTGPIEVALTVDTCGFVELTVTDEGCGMAADVTPRGTGLGSGIIATMTRTLSGTLDYPQRARGVVARLRFKPE